MKNSVKPFFFFLILWSLFNPMILSATEEPIIYADASLIIDAETGSVLYGENQYEQLGIASITKLMTVYVFLEEAKAQELSLDDTYPIGARSASLVRNNTELSGVPFNEGEIHSIQELLELAIIYSDNGAAIELAVIVSGTEQEHVNKMNEQAKAWGMEETVFYNVTGLTNVDYADVIIPGADPDAYNVSSATDVATMDYYIIKEYPQILKVTSQPTMKYYSDTIYNWNLMLPGGSHEYEGVIGLKTGHSVEAKYCFTSYYTLDDKSYITVVLGADSTDERFSETAKLLDYVNLLEFETAITTDATYEINLKGDHGGAKSVHPQMNLIKTTDQNLQLVLNSITYNDKYFDNDTLIKEIPAGEVVATANFIIINDEEVGYVFDDAKELNIPLVSDDNIKIQNMLERSITRVYNFFVDFSHQVI